MTKHPSQKIMNFRHLLGCDTIAIGLTLAYQVVTAAFLATFLCLHRLQKVELSSNFLQWLMLFLDYTACYSLRLHYITCLRHKVLGILHRATISDNNFRKICANFVQET